MKLAGSGTEWKGGIVGRRIRGQRGQVLQGCEAGEGEWDRGRPGSQPGRDLGLKGASSCCVAGECLGGGRGHSKVGASG